MTPDNKLATRHSPMVLLTVATALTWVTVAWCVLYSFSTYQDAKMTIERDLRMDQLRGTIVHLDEVLTMSARMAAATGDLAWETRYLAFEPRLDAAIKEAMKLAPEALATNAAAKTDEANLRLVEMEHQAFDLLQQGRGQEAKGVLFSEQYEAQKQIYAQGMTEFTDGLSRATNASLQRNHQRAFAHVFAVAVLVPLVAGAWLVTFRATRRWIRTITTGNRQLASRTAELNNLNRTLDEKVNARTRELAAVNMTFEAEIIEHKRAEEQLGKKVAELEKFSRLAVGREQRMIELKREVNQMAEKAGLEGPYDLSFASSHEEAAASDA